MPSARRRRSLATPVSNQNITSMCRAVGRCKSYRKSKQGHARRRAFSHQFLRTRECRSVAPAFPRYQLVTIRAVKPCDNAYERAHKQPKDIAVRTRQGRTSSSTRARILYDAVTLPASYPSYSCCNRDNYTHATFRQRLRYDHCEPKGTQGGRI